MAPHDCYYHHICLCFTSSLWSKVCVHIPSLLFHCKLYIVYKPVYIHIHMHNQHTLISTIMRSHAMGLSECIVFGSVHLYVRL